MCLTNNNIEVEKKEERKENLDITYEERIEIESMLRSRIKYTITEIAKKLNRDKSVISREINRNCERKCDYKKHAF